MLAPTTTQLNELTTLLHLMQAVNDPVKSQEAIDSLLAERKKYDDSIAESQRLIAETEASAVKAQETIDKARETVETLANHQASIDAQSAELAIRSAMADERDASIVAKEAQVQAIINGLQAKSADDEIALNRKIGELEAARAEYEARQANLDKGFEELAVAKDDYEAKVAKLKALTE